MQRSVSETVSMPHLARAQRPKRESIQAMAAPSRRRRLGEMFGARLGYKLPSWLSYLRRAFHSSFRQIGLTSIGQKLRTHDDALHQTAEAIATGRELRTHILDKYIIRKQQRPPESIS